MTKSKAAFLFACSRLGQEKLYLWTFTFADVLAVKDTRKKWNHLLTLLLLTWPDLCGIRVFELHKEHGLHVHLVTNQFIDVNKARELAQQAGWGRIHVTPMPAAHVGYLAKYLSKERPACLKHWRLWAAFGEGWEPAQCKDIEKQSLFSKIYRSCKEWKGWKGRGDFFTRMDITRQMMFLTIENGWTPGLGPNEKPYWMCCDEELELKCPRCDFPF